MEANEILKTARQLQAELKALNEQYEQVKKQEALAALDCAWSDTAKIAAFDRLKEHALFIAKEIITTGYRDDDADHYLYEATMQETLGKNVFDILNKF